LSLSLNRIFSEKDKEQMVVLLREEFAPMFKNVINKVQVSYNHKVSITLEGVFGNKDLMHSLLNYISIQIIGGKFAADRYATNASGCRGRSDIVVTRNNMGVFIEMKYNSENSRLALEQAKGYATLVKDADMKVFIGINITAQQEVFMTGEIVGGNESTQFEYP